MSKALLTERFQMNRDGIKVDRAAGTISGVRLCGEKSKNNRRYRPEKVFKNARAIYEGKPSYHGHARDGEEEFRNLAAKIIYEGEDAQGFPRGTLKLFMSDPMANKVLEVAETAPELIGMSHRAYCESTFRDGVDDVDAIIECRSVDIVMDAATNPKGFAESTRKTMPNKVVWKKYVESLIPKLPSKKMISAKRFCEMDAIPAELEMPEPEEGVDAEGGLDEAICELCNAVLKDGMETGKGVKEIVSKIEAYLNAHMGETKPAEEKPPEGEKKEVPEKKKEDGEEEEKKKEKEESFKRLTAFKEASSLAGKLKIVLSDSDLEIVAAAKPDLRESTAKKLFQVNENGAKPRSGGRDIYGNLPPGATAPKADELPSLAAWK